MQAEQKEKIVDYLKAKLDPVFIYLIEDVTRSKQQSTQVEILYFAGLTADDTLLYEIEDTLMRFSGCDVILTELSKCDAMEAEELLAEGKLLYCQDEQLHKKYLFALAREYESAQVRRRALIERLKDCGTAFVN